MKKFEIFLKSIIQAKNFCDAIKDFDFDIELSDGKNTANAKNVMDVLTLDLSKHITVVAHTENSEFLDEKIKDYIV